MIRDFDNIGGVSIVFPSGNIIAIPAQQNLSRPMILKGGENFGLHRTVEASKECIYNVCMHS